MLRNAVDFRKITMNEDKCSGIKVMKVECRQTQMNADEFIEIQINLSLWKLVLMNANECI